ncbi:MAG: hypothetical protein U9N09_01850 [Euryarchaeota archaeon]|nr:hypothetical protein [Euryarchaeota archaeon]
METVTIPKEVWSPISSLVHRGLFENERSAIVNIVHDLSLSKMKEYEMAMQRFETKYGVIFEDFEQQLNSSDKEDFGRWDDYIEWKAYSGAYHYWKSVHEESSRCL